MIDAVLLIHASTVLQNAHLVPQSEGPWFYFREQYRHNSSPDVTVGVDDVSNCVAMRADLHNAFDAPIYAPAVVCGTLVAYFIAWDPHLAMGYHKVRLNISDQVSLRHVFSRFAYNIIKKACVKSMIAAVPVPKELVKTPSVLSSKPPSG
jgi:hypothetical protein